MGHPTELDTFMPDFEELRNNRNTVGHAFGRDIAQSRKHEEVKALPLTGIKEERLLLFFDVTYKVVKAIDLCLLDNQIGEYQALFAFHVFKNQNKSKKCNTKQWADMFRDKYTTPPFR